MNRIRRSRKLNTNNINNKRDSITTNKTFVDNGFVLDNNIINKNNKKKSRHIFIILVLFSASIILLFFYYTNKKFNSYDVIWKQNIASSIEYSGSINYDRIDDYIVRYSNDGVRLFNLNGEQKYNVSYNIKNPKLSKSDNYFDIFGVSQNEIFVFNDEGMISKFETDFPIIKTKISDSGLVYVLLDAGNNSIITLYDKFGKPVDITIMSVITGDGMPIDFDISDDGLELVVSFIYENDNQLKTRVVYYNFDSKGSVTNNRIVSGFENEFNNKIVARVNFSDNRYSQCIYDGGICFLSKKNNEASSIINKLEFDNIIKSVSISKYWIALVLDDGENNFLHLFNKQGRLLYKKNIKMNYNSFYISNNNVNFINQKRLKIYNENGFIRFDSDIKDNIIYIEKLNSLLSNEFIFSNANFIEYVVLR